MGHFAYWTLCLPFEHFTYKTKFNKFGEILVSLRLLFELWEPNQYT